MGAQLYTKSSPYKLGAQALYDVRFVSSHRSKPDCHCLPYYFLSLLHRVVQQHHYGHCQIHQIQHASDHEDLTDVHCDCSNVPAYVYISLLKEYAKTKALFHARRIHTHLSCHVADLTGSVGDNLVVAFAACGALEDAQNVLLSLQQRSTASWTALLSGYVDYSRSRESLDLFQLMQVDGVPPNQYTFASLFKACAILGDLQEAEKLCVYAEGYGFMSNVFVASTLVSLYGKCGNIVEAENVFCRLSHHNVVCWNSMLSAYIEKGMGAKAIQLYRQMQEEGMSANKRTTVVILQACVSFIEEQGSIGLEAQTNRLVCLNLGRALHANARRESFLSDVFVGSALVSTYSKCGSIVEAENVFEDLPECSFVSWNAMMSAYVDRGRGQFALHMYQQMQKEGVGLRKSTIVIAVKACTFFIEEKRGLDVGAQGFALAVGRALHDDARRSGFLPDVSLGSILVTMYGACGSIREAEYIFIKLFQRNTVTWGSMISVYLQHGQIEESLRLFRQMLEENVKPVEQTYIITLQACGDLAEKDGIIEQGYLLALNIGIALHAYAKKMGVISNMTVCSSVMRMYGKFGCIVEAENMFIGMYYRSVASWSVLLSAYIKLGQGQKALLFYLQMHLEGVSSDKQAHVIALQACGALAGKQEGVAVESELKKMMLEVGQALHFDAERKDFSTDIFVSNTLVSLYGKCGCVSEAEYLFDRILQRDVASWNAMLSVYTEQGQEEKSLYVYRQMREECAIMDDVTFLGILQACSQAGSLEVCRQAHFDVVCAGCDSQSLVASSLIRVYGSCANMVDAQVVLDGLSHVDSVLWSACIAGYAQEGNTLASFHLLEEMLRMGIHPHNVTFLSLISACTQAGLVYRGLKCFEAMVKEYGMAPDSKHYVNILDLLGRAGDFTWVENILFGMMPQPDLAVWNCLLAKCCFNYNTDLGKLAFDCVDNLMPNQGSPYVLMSNIYASEVEIEGQMTGTL